LQTACVLLQRIIANAIILCNNGFVKSEVKKWLEAIYTEIAFGAAMFTTSGGTHAAQSAARVLTAAGGLAVWLGGLINGLTTAGLTTRKS
jgi:stalled ribosome rescue protein Dom34